MVNRCKYIKLTTFSELHGVSMCNLYTSKSTNYIPSFVFKGQYIDENFYARRQRFKKRVWLKNHDMYFFLSMHLEPGQIAEILAVTTDRDKKCWSSYLSFKLFSRNEKSILSYKVDEMDWLFHRVIKAFIRRLFIKVKVAPKNRHLEILLDKEIR